MTLSLGDGLRPGCLADATDRAQDSETILVGELTERAWAEGVQVMIEGPGHVPLDQIEANVLLERRLCKGPLCLGTLVTDISAGYDHITCAIGGAIAGRAGADFLCYVTPSEHLKLPSVEDVKEGVIATRIAGHAADIARGNRKAMRGIWRWQGLGKTSTGKDRLSSPSIRKRQGGFTNRESRRGRCLHHVRQVLRDQAGERFFPE